MTSLRRKMDKVCDICGDLGFAECIFTCYQCKNASEHIYCMQGQVLTIPDIWHCEVCKLNTQVTHEGNGQDSQIERMSVRGGSSDLETSKTLLEKIPPMNYWRSPEQSTDGEKQVSGAKKLLCSPDNSLKMVDTSKEKRVSVSGSPDKPVTQQLSHNTCFRTVENAKVKFIPSEEVAFLTSRGRSAGRGRKLGASCHQIDLANEKPPPSLRRMSTDVSTSHNPNTLKILAQTNKGSVHAEVHSSDMKHAITTEHAKNNQNAKSLKRKTSEIEASAGLCKKKLTKEYVGAEGYLSSTKLTTPTVSDVPVLPIDEQRNRAAFKGKALADEPPVPHVSGKHVEAFPMNNARPADSKHIDYRLLDTNEKNEKMRTGNVVRHDASSSGFQEMDLLLTMITSPCEKTPNRLTPGAFWKGTFEVFDVIYHSYRIQAHFPCQLFRKAYGTTKKLPEKLKLKILPRVDTWPQAFKIAPPTCDDIALYFISSEFGRHKEKYIHLLERIELHDFAMKTCVDGVELLVYSSKQLPQDSQRIDAEPFLWGVFRHLKHKKQCQEKQQQSLSRISAAVMNSTCLGQFGVSSDASCREVDEVIDMVGGSEIGRIDRPILRIVAPPGFPKPISRDAPPGFSKPISRDVSHLKHKKKCWHKQEQSHSCISGSVMKNTSLGQFDVSSNGNCQEVDMGIDLLRGIEFCRMDRPALRMDAPAWSKPISTDVSHLKQKKQCQDKQEQSFSWISASVMKSTSLDQFNVSSDNNCQEVDMEIDMVGGRQIGRIDRPILRIGAPPGFTKPISRDVPPGFSKPISRDVSQKQCRDKQEQSLSCISASVMKSTSLGQFGVSSDDNCQEVDMEIDMVGRREIGRVDIPILRIDAPPGFLKPISRDVPGFSKPISIDVSHDRRSLAKFLPHVPPGFSKTTFKHGSSSPDLTPKGQNLCMKDKRGSVSFSSGERHATTNLEACEGQPKCHQVSGHWHKSVEHGFSNGSAEKKKEFNSIDSYSYEKEKTSPWTDTKPCSASITLPSLSAKRKVDSSSEKPLQRSCTKFGGVVLPSTPSSSEKQESRFFKKPTYYGDGDSHMTDTEAHSLHMNMTPNSSKEKGQRPCGKPSDKNFAQVAQVGEGVWPSGTGIKESKITGCMMVPKATEGNEEMENQSTMDRRQEMKMIAPRKQRSKRVKENMERQSNSNPENKQISLVSENYKSVSSSLIQPLLSGRENRTDGEGVWPSGTGIKESKMTGCMMVPKATERNEEMENQSTIGQRQEMKMIAPRKQRSKRVKENMERQSNSNPENKQISLVSENCKSPSSSLIQPLLSGSANRTDGEGVWPPGTGIKDSKITGCMMVPKATEGNEEMENQSTMGRTQEMKMIAPRKQRSKRVRGNMVRQSNSNPENKQISLVSENHENPSSSLIQPLLSGSANRTDGVPESKTLVSEKWHLKEDIKGTKNMENQCRLVKGKKQQCPLSPSYGTPFRISKQPLLSTGSDSLPLRPQDSETMKTPKKVASTVRQAVSRDFRLSTPKCMKDGNA